MSRAIPSILVASFVLSGCTGMTDTQQRVTTGGLGGAAGGAILGAIGGNAALGAAAGAGAGLIGGYIYDKYKKNQQETYESGVQAGRSGM
jgi:uncharacterized membrane protein